ncbi:TPA: hypothetical protein ACSTJ2_005051, partial [Serratia fonticola]
NRSIGHWHRKSPIVGDGGSTLPQRKPHYLRSSFYILKSRGLMRILVERGDKSHSEFVTIIR